MTRWISFVLVIVVLTWLLVGCGDGDESMKVGLDEEFSLAVGQSAAVTGEYLEIEFLRIKEDSRCPRNATCIWEGRACCLVELTAAGTSEQKELKIPGLTDEYNTETYGDYQLTFNLEPYPEVDQQILRNEYRLLLIISKR